jgi:small-conductance mechanosensitive channel
MLDMSLQENLRNGFAAVRSRLHGREQRTVAVAIAPALPSLADPAAAVPTAALPIDYQPLDWSTITSPGRFFERQALGWDAHSPLEAAAALWQALENAVRLLLGGTFASAAVGATLVALLLVLFAALALVDRRVIRAAGSGQVSLPFAEHFATLLVPCSVAAALFASQQLLGPSLPARTFALLALFLAGSRLLQVPVSLLSFLDLGADGASPAARLRRHLVYPGRVILGLSALIVVAQAIAVAPAVIDLFTLVRNVAFMLAVLALLPVRADLMALFPATGNPRYVAVRAIVSRLLLVLLASSLLLLLLWNLGFARAAETLLLRSYAVLAVVLAGALASRWLGDKEGERSGPHHPVLKVLVGPADWVLRLVVYGVLGWALLATLGLWSPLAAILAQPFLWVGTGGVSLLGLSKGAAILIIAAYVSRTVRAAMEVWWFGALDMPAATQNAASTGAHYLTMLIAGAGALTLSGIDLRGLAVFAGAAGLGIGFGLREVAAQTISGMTLLFGGTLGKGDSVTLPSGEFGRVMEIGLRRTLFETPDGREISVPSSDLVNGQIVVWTRKSPFVRVQAEVILPVGTDLERARSVLAKAADSVQCKAATQPSKVWLRSALPTGLVWEAMAWVDIAETTPEEASAGLLRACLAALAESELELARPTLSVTQR